MTDTTLHLYIIYAHLLQFKNKGRGGEELPTVFLAAICNTQIFC